MIKIFSFLLILFSFSYASQIPCVKSIGEGEALIKNSLELAKQEAILNAKWNAVENALGVHIKTKTVIDNYKLLDEIIVKEVKGFITDINIISEEKTKNSIKIKVKGCVYPEEAEKVVSLLTKNTSISIYFFLENKNLKEFNTLDTNLIKTLRNQGFNIIEIKDNMDFSTTNLNKIKKILLQNLSGAIILGKVYTIPVTLKGQYIGYGLTSPFYVIKAVAEYKFLVKDKNNIKILFSDAVSDRGIAINIKLAKHNALNRLGNKLSNNLIQNLNNYLKIKKNKVILKVEGVYSFEETFKIKSEIQKLPWVKSVRDIDFGQFEIIYYENPIYLAYSLQNSLNFRILEYSPSLIRVEK